MTKNQFYKTIEKIYLRCDDMYDKEDMEKYEQGRLKIPKSEIVDFAVATIGVGFIIISDIALIVLYFMDKI